MSSILNFDTRENHRTSGYVKILLCSFALLCGCASLRPPPLSASDRKFLQAVQMTEVEAMAIDPKISRQLTRLRKIAPARIYMDSYIERRFGITTLGGKMVGLEQQPIRQEHALVFNCAVCHSGTAAGRFIPGLGNKTFDTFEGGRAVLEVLTKRAPKQDPLSRAAYQFAHTIGDPVIANPTQGLVNDVLVWQRLHPPFRNEKRPSHLVKVPHLWGYSEKVKAGYFHDGLGRGIGWLAAVPLAAGMSVESVRAQVPNLRAIDATFRKLEAPEYPFAIEEEKRADGARLFASNCRGCHGAYQRDGAGNHLWAQPKMIPIGVAGTDRARLRFAPGFFAAVDRHPLGQHLRRNRHPPGYFAPRLEGIWARFPYLHNGSVPNLAAILTPPKDRPRIFSVARAGSRARFDPDEVGLSVPRPESFAGRRLAAAARKGSRTVYDTTRYGQSNEGHPFGTHLTALEKSALIEYLKSL